MKTDLYFYMNGFPVMKVGEVFDIVDDCVPNAGPSSFCGIKSSEAWPHSIDASMDSEQKAHMHAYQLPKLLPGEKSMLLTNTIGYT